MGFPGGSAVRNMPVVQETWVRALVGKISWRAWHPLQYSCLENPRDREAWQAAVHRVAQSQTQLNDSAHSTYNRIIQYLHTL